MTPEGKLLKKIEKYLNDRNIYFRKQHGNMFSKIGTPDLFICYKGYFVAIECKREDGKGTVSELQLWNIKEIQNNGGYAAIIDNFNDFVKFIENIGGEK